MPWHPLSIPKRSWSPVMINTRKWFSRDAWGAGCQPPGCYEKEELRTEFFWLKYWIHVLFNYLVIHPWKAFWIEFEWWGQRLPVSIKVPSSSMESCRFFQVHPAWSVGHFRCMKNACSWWSRLVVSKSKTQHIQNYTYCICLYVYMLYTVYCMPCIKCLCIYMLYTIYIYILHRVPV